MPGAVRCEENPLKRSLCGSVEADAVAEVLQLGDEPVALAVGVAAGEVVAAEVVVVAVVGQQVPADDQDGVTDGDGGLLLADPAGQSPEPGGQVGVVGAGGGPGALGEDVEQPDIAVGGLARAAFAAGDVVARAYPGPGGQVGSGREAGHVGADLGEDALGGPLADSGDGVEPVTGLGERDAGLAGVLGEQIVDVLVQLRDRALQVGEVVQAEPDQQGVVVTEAAAQCLAQLGELLAQQALGQLGEDVGVAFAGDQGGQHRPSGDAEHLGGDRAQLDPGVLEGLLNALGLGGAGLDQRPAVAGEIPKLPDPRRGPRTG